MYDQSCGGAAGGSEGRGEGGGQPHGRSRQAAPGAQGLMWHASDTVARPLVGNRAIERVSRPTCDPAALPFPALVLAQLPCPQDF